jgi:signal transduction histidine kinase
MRLSLLTMVRRPRPSLALGVLAAALLLTIETSAAPLLKPVVSVHSLHGVYMPGIVAISSVWGIGLGLATAVASTVAFDYFVLPPVWDIQLTSSEDLAILAFLMGVAFLTWVLSKRAGWLAMEYGVRREADLSGALARILLPAHDLKAALPAAARCLARTIGLPSALIVPGTIDPDERHVAFPLDGGNGALATLLVPARLPRPVMWRLRTLVVPSLKVLLEAAGERERFADEQAALRRLATLVAHGAPPTEVFGAVAREMGQILEARHALVVRYEPDGTATCVGTWNEGDLEATMPLGSHWPLETGSVSELVARTWAPGRINAYDGEGPFVTTLRERGVVSCVGCPILVGGSLWGLAIVSSSTSEPLPDDTEERVFAFAELTATSIANAQSHDDLKASRARVVAAADETRRCIERDLHDGTQQRLIAIGLMLHEAQLSVPPQLQDLQDHLSHTAHHLQRAVVDLQEISRGLHPAVLAEDGLSVALKMLARRSGVAVKLNVCLRGRLPTGLEVTIYYVVSEALANAAKHAHPSVVHVGLTASDSLIRLSIRDDGVGGADPARGSGLVGLTDRVEAVGGKFTVVSPKGRGTSLLAEIPINNIQ